MRARDTAATVAALVLAVAATGCATRFDPHPPPGWLQPARVASREPNGFGAWCALRFQSRPKHVEGELISVDSDSVLVLTTDGLVARPTADLSYATFAIGYYAIGQNQVKGLSRADRHRMQPFARFPQGVPAGIDPRTLLPKP